MSSPSIDPAEMIRAAGRIEAISARIQEKIGTYEKTLASTQDWRGATRRALENRVTNQLIPELKTLKDAVANGATTLRTTTSNFQEHDHVGSTGMGGAEGSAATPALRSPLNEAVV